MRTQDNEVQSMFRPLNLVREYISNDIWSEQGDLFIRCRIKPERDPFLCTCGPCKKFWRDTFSENADILHEPTVCRARGTATLSVNNKVVKVGDRVLVDNKHKAPDCLFEGQAVGTVKWVGVLDENAIAPELYVGIRLDDNVNSTHNGVYNGKRYFYVPRGHGAMVKYTDVVPLKPPQKRPPVNGNYMFPSWEEVQKRRKERNQKLQSMYATAGMAGPQFSEPYVSKPGSQSSQRPIRSEPTIHISDPNDIALKDMERKQMKDKIQRSTVRESHEHKEMDRLKEQFGGGPEAERLALTLKKLQSAYQEGKAVMRRRSQTGLEKDSAASDISDY